MAASLSKSHSTFALFFFFILAVSAKPKPRESSFRLLQPGLALGKEKMSHLHFYWHDVISGPKPTTIQVAAAQSTRNSSTFFGSLYIIDDPLTEGSDPKSKMLGRAQGFYASASQEEVGLMMGMNFAFSDGKYNGSTITILGRNTVFSEVREMPVLGGSGLFRFARGYAHAQTHSFNLTTGDAIVEYNVYVIHY
ncbi:hypothetical protein ACLOJK_033273 [Asimina triloba]